MVQYIVPCRACAISLDHAAVSILLISLSPTFEFLLFLKFLIQNSDAFRMLLQVDLDKLEGQFGGDDAFGTAEEAG